MKCYNCDKNAMFSVGPEGKQIPLCLDCYIRFQNLQLQQLAASERQINFLIAQAESVTGVPGILPRYPTPPQPQIIQTGGMTMNLNNINVSGSEIGVLNTGTIENVDATVTVLKTSGNDELAQVVKELSELVIRSNEINNDLKNKILELLSTLSSEAVAPKNKRKIEVVKILISELTRILSGIATVADFWVKAKGIFDQVFGF